MSAPVVQRKIAMLGMFSVGKSSLVRRYVHSLFSDRYQSTIGVKIDKKTVRVRNAEVNLVIWDLAGETEAEPIRDSYLRGAGGYLLIADGTRAVTLDATLSIQRRAAAVAGDVPFVLVVNKADLRGEWEVSEEELAELQEEHRWTVLHASAKDGIGVEAAFAVLSQRMLDEPRRGV